MRLMCLFGLLVGLLPFELAAQNYVGLTEKKVQSRLKKETRKSDRADRMAVQTPGSSKTFSGSRSRSVDLQLSCDSAGVCYSEQYLCKDESAALQWQKKILAQKEFGWQKLNENQHVSVMERQLLLEIYRAERYWVVQVLRTNWSPLQYRLLFSNETK